MSDFANQSPFERDADGRLYDRNARGYLVSFVGEESARRLEPFAAVRWLMKEMHQFSHPLAERHDLSQGRLDLLMRLKWGGDAPLGELAQLLHVSARNITGLVDHLERDGLVERVPDPNDRRSVRAHLTDQGLEKVDTVWRDMLERTLEVTDELSQDDLDHFRDVSLRIIQRLQARRSEAASTPRGGKENT